MLNQGLLLERRTFNVHQKSGIYITTQVNAFLKSWKHLPSFCDGVYKAIIKGSRWIISLILGSD